MTLGPINGSSMEKKLQNRGEAELTDLNIGSGETVLTSSASNCAALEEGLGNTCVSSANTPRVFDDSRGGGVCDGKMTSHT